MTSGVAVDQGLGPDLATHQVFARLLGIRAWREAVPLILTTLSSIAFLLVQPGVNDLWAARARADASAHGVGLTYWFSWFAGGATPGAYSVITPWLSRWFTAEGVLAVSGAIVVAICWPLLRPTVHGPAATYLAALGTCINVWQGHVPFVLGCAFAAGALLCAREHRWLWSSLLALGTLVSSPVSGAFLGLGLIGLLVARSRHRALVLVPITTLVAGVTVNFLVFGNPGVEPMTLGLAFGMCAVLLTFLIPRPVRGVQITIYLSIAVVIVMMLVPNGMGSNFARFVWFCLPVAVVALSHGRRRYLVAISVLCLGIGSVGLAVDLRDAAAPASSPGYYKPLTHRLASVSDLAKYRLEVVDDGTHTAAYALLDHATLARGFETQADTAYNEEVRTQAGLTPLSYRRWLNYNSVGYVAANRHPLEATAESTLILRHAPAYLHQIWGDRDWLLFRYNTPTPIVQEPATLVAIDQAQLTVRVPCACAVTVRTRWSRLLIANLRSDPSVSAGVTADPAGWTVLTTTKSGVYLLQGR